MNEQKFQMQNITSNWSCDLNKIASTGF